MDNPAPTRRHTNGIAVVGVVALVVAMSAAMAAAMRGQQGRSRSADDAVTDNAVSVAGTPAAVVARGAALYAAHCASCHGANLEGQPDWKRPLPDGSLPAPPHDVSGHTWHHGDGELLRIIAKGGTIYMPESKMPGYERVLSDDDMRAVLTFIKSSWGPEQLDWQAQVTAGEVGPQAAP
ncbi:MAG: cytochrome c [Ardenticatenales bacterium]|nr:cytochrome c [Ardenticatenales bacterium]